MKIVQLITDLYSRGGAEVFLESLSLALVNPNDEIYVVSIWKQTHPSFNEFIANKKVKYYSCGKTKSSSIIKPARNLNKILKSIKPDVVNTHRNVYPTYFLAFGFKKNKWNLVHTFHNIASKESTQLGKKILSEYLSKDKIHPVAISDCISNTICDCYPIKKRKIRTIYNGFKIREIHREQFESKKIYDFIVVARFDEQKNHMFLLDVLEKLKISNIHCKVALVGNGSLFERCRDFVLEHNLQDMVHFIGEVNDPYPYLLSSKCFLLTSIYEGNPISILEAMNAGLPVISSNVGGVPDVVKDKVNGFLFKSGDAKQLERVLIDALQNPDYISDIGKYNSEYVKKFSIENCAVEYRKYYEDIKSAH